MNQNLVEAFTSLRIRHPGNSKLTVSRSELWHLPETRMTGVGGATQLGAGLMLALNVPKGMLSQARKEHGMQTIGGLLTLQSVGVLVLLLRAGKYLTVSACDLADPLVKRFAAQSLQERSMRLMLLDGTDQMVTCPPVDELVEEAFLSIDERAPADFGTYLKAARVLMHGLSDPAEVARMGLDAKRLRAVMMNLHLSDALFGGLLQSPGASSDQTLH